ncbi:hypothetical protein MOV08_42065 [Streptomyces yunnanensis]|uniref:Uncharacterized protein n=1 Tax=Streptomyces yunnanensis TaxID=156453 RepID=A0ABY8AM77_9ACTN|nr:hypothetical protein [Streptomyces yunnanensis]WEB45239.1 hypothetical protein MOV08_42065 [Streptomyces yunnanensis]
MTDQHSNAVAFAELHRLADHFFHGRADLDDAAHRLQAGSQAGAEVLLPAPAVPRVASTAVLDAAAEPTGPGTFGSATSALGPTEPNALPSGS